MITCPKVEQPLPRRGCLFLSWAFGFTNDFFIIYHISRPTVKCIFFFRMTSKIKPSRRNLNHRVVAFRTQSSNRLALFFLYLPITDASVCAHRDTFTQLPVLRRIISSLLVVKSGDIFFPTISLTFFFLWQFFWGRSRVRIFYCCLNHTK